MVEIALLAWIPFTAMLFIVLKPHVAAAVSMIFGVALLPAQRAIPIPVLPDLTQYTVPVMSCLLMTILRYPQRLVAARPGRGAELLILIMIAGALITNLTNTDPQVFGANVLPGMTVTDTVNDAFKMIFRWGLPFLIGRVLVRTRREGIEVLMVLALAGLFYVPFVLVELQTGPYFHALIYGAPPSRSTFWHSLKYGGFRPVVLMNHGLTTSAFMLYTTIAWVGMMRLKAKAFRIPNGPVVAVMVPLVAFCKSRAVWIYGITVIPALLFTRPKLQILAATSVAAIILTYPFLRSLDLLPVDAVGELAAEYGGYEAAQSFLQRIETEGEILARTSERYWFGWGGYSRHFVYDPVTGRPLSVMDGLWLIEFGMGGLFRFLTLYTFLLFPVLYTFLRMDRLQDQSTRVVICALVWIVVLRTFDTLPNSTVDPYLTFMGGAVCGLVKFESARPRMRRRRKHSSTSSDEEPSTSSPPVSLAAGLQERGDPSRLGERHRTRSRQPARRSS